MTVYEKLFEAKDDEYRAFQIKLVPGIPEDKVLGVRTPQMRKIAKEIYLGGDMDEFLRELPHTYHEENLVHFFLIAMIRDFGRCVRETDAFLPYVDCWPVSDQATPASFRKNHDKLLPYIEKWISSDHVYTARFGIRMLMNEFLGKDFKSEYLELAASNQGDNYYLKMMIAWYFATALAKQYDESIRVFELHKLDDWVHRKAIQKALESYRIPAERKEYLKNLR